MTPTLTLSDRAARDWAGEASVRKGRDYASADSVLDPVVQGDTLKARVVGTADRPYRVWLRVAGGKVVAGDCSCPVGDSGKCKHGAAVLMYYRDEPDEFTAVEDADASLQRRDKAELIALIKQMLRKAPELESLLAAPVPGGKRNPPPSPDVYRRQAAAVLRGVPEYEEWAGEAAADDLGAILDTAEEFEHAGDRATAAAAYQGVAAAAVDDGRDLLSGDGDPESVPGRLAAGLLRSLDHERPDTPRREALLRTLFDLTVAFFSWSDGGGDFDPLDGMLSVVTPRERRTLSGWAKQLRPARDGYGSDFDRQRFARVLTRVDADVLGDDGYLDVCRKAGMTREVVAKLLALGRGDEAVREVATAVTGDRRHELVHYAEMLEAGGQGAAAERLVRERAEKADAWVRVPMLDWLAERATARADKPEMLRLAEATFAAQPSLARYRTVRKLTPKAQWADRRAAILREQSRNPALRIDVYLDEGDVAAALDVLKANRGSGRAQAVADAAAATHPAEALALYRQLAEREIEHRNRGAYQEACRFLGKAGACATRAGAAAEFRRYVVGLLETHSSLRAFKEEVAKAKLVADVPPTAVRRVKPR